MNDTPRERQKKSKKASTVVHCKFSNIYNDCMISNAHCLKYEVMKGQSLYFLFFHHVIQYYV